MLMMKERRPETRTLRGWAILLLNEAGAIRECEADPYARERAFDIVRQNPPPGVSADAAAVVSGWI